MRERDNQIQKFRQPGTSVLLMSLKCGVGLNLTDASTVILCEPWWNPGVEEQAIDRAHRIGQQRPVKVIRLVLPGTVEEKIAALQVDGDHDFILSLLIILSLPVTTVEEEIATLYEWYAIAFCSHCLPLPLDPLTSFVCTSAAQEKKRDMSRAVLGDTEGGDVMRPRGGARLSDNDLMRLFGL